MMKKIDEASPNAVTGLGGGERLVSREGSATHLAAPRTDPASPSNRICHNLWTFL